MTENESLICPKCNADVKEGAKYCNHCGHQIKQVCQKCGMTLKAEAKFCNACGSKAGIEATKPLNEKDRSVLDEIGSTTKLKKRKTRILAIIGCAIIIIGGFLLINYYQKNLSPAANATKTAQNAELQTQYALIDQTATAEEAKSSVQSTEGAITASIEATRTAYDASYAFMDEEYPVQWISPDGTRRLYLIYYDCSSGHLTFSLEEYYLLKRDAPVIEDIQIDYGNLVSPSYEDLYDMGVDPINSEIGWYGFDYTFPFERTSDLVWIWITFEDGTAISLQSVFSENGCGQ